MQNPSKLFCLWLLEKAEHSQCQNYFTANNTFLACLNQIGVALNWEYASKNIYRFNQFYCGKCENVCNDDYIEINISF